MIHTRLRVLRAVAACLLAWLAGGCSVSGIEVTPESVEVPADWARDNLQNKVCVQGNLDPMLMVTGGESLERETKRLLDILGDGPYIFNLGHGITPDADPANVEKMLNVIRG